MRAGLYVAVTLAICIGCNPLEDARRKATENNLKQLGQAIQNYHQSHQPEAARIVIGDTAYYRTGPQQAQPPDGTFAAGTKVSIVREAGSYVQVRSDDGTLAYVAADSLQQPRIDPSNISE